MNKLKNSWLMWGAFCGLGVTGCATTKEQAHTQDMQSTMASLRIQNSAYLRQIEELENQVFILSDRMESSQVNAQRTAAPALPTVKLDPEQPKPQRSNFEGYDQEVSPPLGEHSRRLGAMPEPQRSFEDDPYSSVPDSQQVEYVGDAARTSEERPVLRLVGDSGGISDGREHRAEVLAAAPMRKRTQVDGGGPSEAQASRAPTTVVARGAHSAVNMYRTAKDLLAGGQHADAAASFREFLRVHPSHDYADNAQYWLGECYYDLKDYVSAAREFRRVVEAFPDGNKVPDAMLKAGFSYLALGKTDDGRRTLEALKQAYPQHGAAALAQDRLATLQE